MKMLTRPKKACCAETVAQCCAKSSPLATGCHD